MSAQAVLDAMRGSGAAATVQNTATEQRVANIWASLLGTTAIQPSDNFFDLGGHSLLMVQMVMRIREAFGDGVDGGRCVFGDVDVGRFGEEDRQRGLGRLRCAAARD